jgi:hypothetical protein
VNHNQALKDLERRLLSAIRQRDAWKTKSQYHYECGCAFVAALEHECAELSVHAEHAASAAKDVFARIAESPRP